MQICALVVGSRLNRTEPPERKVIEQFSALLRFLQASGRCRACYRVHRSMFFLILRLVYDYLHRQQCSEGLLIQHTVYRTVPAPWSRLFEATAPYTTTTW